jgi:hypothetical protein
VTNIKENFQVYLHKNYLSQIFLGSSVKYLGTGVAHSSMIRAERSGVWIPVGAGSVSLLKKISTRSLGSIQRVEGPAREVKYSLPCRADVRNEWSYTSTLPMCLHGVDIVNVNFYTVTRK